MDNKLLKSKQTSVKSCTYTIHTSGILTDKICTPSPSPLTHTHTRNTPTPRKHTAAA